jgi:hypothetical protein
METKAIESLTYYDLQRLFSLGRNYAATNMAACANEAAEWVAMSLDNNESAQLLYQFEEGYKKETGDVFSAFTAKQIVLNHANYLANK